MEKSSIEFEGKKLLSETTKEEEVRSHQKPLGGPPQKPYYDNFKAGRRVS